MKGFSINTQSFPFDLNDINNVYSFTSITGNTCFSNITTSTYYDNYCNYADERKIHQQYAINLDWFQFICKPINNRSILDAYCSRVIHIEKSTTHNNPNFRNNYKIYYQGVEVCELFTVPLNNKHKIDEVSCKVTNAILYLRNWSYLIVYVLQELNLKIMSINKVAIALDGNKNSMVLDLCRRYLRNRTIQINNNNLEITPQKFKKSELKWAGYNIGNKRYQKHVRVYDKVAEIKKTGKNYIIDFWKLNGIDIDAVVRFELELGKRHLKKYQFNTIHDFRDAGLLSKILFAEVHTWLRFYQVRLDDILHHRKDIAVRRGKERAFIAWEKLPQSTQPLNTIEILPNDLINAKKTITFTLRQMSRSITTDNTDTMIKYVYNIAKQFKLQAFTNNRINILYNHHLPDDEAHPIVLLWKALLTDNHTTLSADI